MSTWNQLRTTALLLALFAPAAVLAQGGPGSGPGACGGCGRMGERAGAGPRMFDTKTVTTVQGEVSDIEHIEHRHHGGVHLTLAMGSETVTVHLGPDFYLEGQELQLKEGDKVEVKGSRVTVDGKPLIVAQEVRRGNLVLALRDANGAPLWRGRGMGHR